MKIIVNSYHNPINTLNKQKSDFTIEIEGKFSYISGSMINVKIDNYGYLKFKSFTDILEFSKDIVGSNQKQFLQIINEKKISYTEKLSDKIQELDIYVFNTIKSTFLILKHLELPLLDQDMEDPGFLTMFYDDFILDFNKTEGPQNDIYLLKQEYINKYQEILDYLVTTQNLSKILVFPFRNEKKVNYFIPINQLGMENHSYSNMKLKNGEVVDVSIFFNKLKIDRNMRIDKWNVLKK